MEAYVTRDCQSCDFWCTAESLAASQTSNGSFIVTSKMASTSGLPPLDPLFKSNSKRTYSVFSSYPDAGLKEEEKRCLSVSSSSEPFQ